MFQVLGDLTTFRLPTGARSRDAETLCTTGLKGFAAGKQGHPGQNCQSVASRIRSSAGIQKSPQDGLSPSTSLPQTSRCQAPPAAAPPLGLQCLDFACLLCVLLCTLHTFARARCLPRSLNRMVCRREAKTASCYVVHVKGCTFARRRNKLLSVLGTRDRGVLKGLILLFGLLLALCAFEKHLASRDGMTSTRWG